MPEKFYAVILAAGSGKRMGADIPKQYLMLKGRRIISYSLETFLSIDEIAACVVVCAPEYKALIEEEADKILPGVCGGDETVAGNPEKKRAFIVSGGSERVDSVRNGINKVKAVSEALDGDDCENYVLIHDSARPFATKELVGRCIREVRDKKAVIPGVPVKDTIKVVDESGEVLETLDRSKLMSVQTPQCMDLNLLLKAYEGYDRSGKMFVPTDDASLVEMFTDRKVYITEGEESNIKITTKEDLGG